MNTYLKEVYRFLSENPHSNEVEFQSATYIKNDDGEYENSLGDRLTVGDGFIFHLVWDGGFMISLWIAPEYNFTRSGIAPLLQFLFEPEPSDDGEDGIYFKSIDTVEEFFTSDIPRTVDIVYGMFKTNDKDYADLYYYLQESNIRIYQMIYSFLYDQVYLEK